MSRSRSSSSRLRSSTRWRLRASKGSNTSSGCRGFPDEDDEDSCRCGICAGSMSRPFMLRLGPARVNVFVMYCDGEVSLHVHIFSVAEARFLTQTMP